MTKPITTKLRSLYSLIAASAVVLGLSVGAASASAGEVSKVVSYSDLNLDSAAGTSTLYRRIQAAARGVCAAYEGRDLERIAHRQLCFDNAVAGGVSQVNKSTLTALHNKTVGRLS